MLGSLSSVPAGIITRSISGISLGNGPDKNIGCMTGPGGFPATGTMAVKKAYGLTFNGVVQSTAKAGTGQGLLGHVWSPMVILHSWEPTYAEPGCVASATPAVYEFPD